MIERKIKVGLQCGLQAQGATEFVKRASSFSSEINIIKKNRFVAGKSILDVMCLAVRKGEDVILIADGNDEQDAIEDLTNFLCFSGVKIELKRK
ncbi:HPr family phosphocarrier protein [Neobacillus cucumis]|uniref:HPr family phosphocarrier protein n=1 Tax=Neobacillus cucumis TaxID=1740721 RepID=UPI002E222273|nr:HPr family phosphocarrier protein [Neobacillus cucumis]